MDILQTLLMSYLAIGVAKFVLFLAGAPLAVACLHRKFGLPGNPPVATGYPIVVLSVLVHSFLYWPSMLKSEGWAFFRAYTRREAIRSVLEACRSIQANRASPHISKVS